MSDHLADLAAKDAVPPKGRVHLHLFIKRNGLHRVAYYEDGEGLPARYARQRVPYVSPTKTMLEFDVEWKVSARASSVCRVPGRCVLAEVVPA